MKKCWLVVPILEREFVIDEKPVPVLEPNADLAPEIDLVTALSQTMKKLDLLELEKEELIKRQSRPEELERFMKALLPTLDGFDRLLSMARATKVENEEVNNWLKAIESIYFRLLRLLENFGLYQLQSVGKKVDLNVHEVVEYRPSDEHPHDTVISERQKGYVFRGKLLRDAKVVVAYKERSDT